MAAIFRTYHNDPDSIPKGLKEHTEDKKYNSSIYQYRSYWCLYMQGFLWTFIADFLVAMTQSLLKIKTLKN